MKYLRVLLLFVPVAIVAHFVFHAEVLTFAAACIGLLPLAGLLGESTEELSLHTGPKVGGLLNATLGNAAELIITVVALKAGRVELVKASITGSILGNVLLILGFSLLVGGLKNGAQRFDRGTAGTSSTMMTLAVIGMLIPTFFEVVHLTQKGKPIFAEVADPALDRLSLGVAAALIVIYLLSLLYSFTTPERGIAPEVGVETGKHQLARWSVKRSLAVLFVSTAFVVLLSELLVDALEPVIQKLGVSELFLGVILIPIIGNVAEHLVSVQAAYKNQMDLSLAISLGSSLQIALFVAPLLTFISLLFGKEMTLFFNPFEVVVLGVSVLIAGQIAVDGESNWLEGAQLLAVYTIAGLGFLFL